MSLTTSDSLSYPKVKFQAPGNSKKWVSTYSSARSFHTDAYSTIAFQNVPSSLFSSATQYRGYLPAGTPKRLSSMILKISISVASSSCIVAPVPYWFSKILISTADQNIPIQTFVPENLLLHNVLESEEGNLPQVLREMAIRPDTFGPPASIASGGVKTYFLPLEGVFTSWLNAYWAKAVQPLIFDFFTQDPRISGSGTISCTELSLLCPNEKLTSLDRVAMDQVYPSGIYPSIYLDPVLLTAGSQTITAGSAFKVDLSPLVGQFAALAFGFRQAGATNSSNGLFMYEYVPESTQVDVTDQAGNSLYGQGSTVNVGQLQDYDVGNQIRNTFFRNKGLVIIPFCKELRGAMRGQVNGAMRFDGSRNYLSITQPANGTALVFTVTNAGTNNQGTYKLQFGNYRTAPLAYNANASTIQTALNALPSMQSYKGVKLTATVSAALNTGTPTITISPKIDLGDDLIEVVDSTMSASGTPDTSGTATTISTSPVIGANGSSQTLDVIVVGLKYRQVNEVQGRFVNADQEVA